MNNEWQNLKLSKTPEYFRGKSKLYVQIWWIVNSLAFKTSPQVFYGWRRFLLRCFGAKIGKNVLIRSSVSITYPWKLEIGDYSWVGDEVCLYSLGNILIGSNSVISQKSYLCAGGHDYHEISFSIFQKPIVIGNQCWLATDVFVAPGVRIADGVVVGARSSVHRNLDKVGVYFGNPAEFHCERHPHDHY